MIIQVIIFTFFLSPRYRKYVTKDYFLVANSGQCTLFIYLRHFTHHSKQKYVVQMQCICIAIISILSAVLMTSSNECSRFSDSFKILTTMSNSFCVALHMQFMQLQIHTSAQAYTHTHMHCISVVWILIAKLPIWMVLHARSADWLLLCHVICVWVSILHFNFASSLYFVLPKISHSVLKWYS